MKITSHPANLWTNVLLASFLLSIFAACDQSGMYVDNDNTASPQEEAGAQIPVVENRLAFKDMEAFSDFMDAFAGSESVAPDEFQMRDGFTSLRTTAEQLMDEIEETLGEAEDVLDLEIVEDPYFAAVL